MSIVRGALRLAGKVNMPLMLILRTITKEPGMKQTRCPTHPGEILREDSLPAVRGFIE
jgi:hypothetical protein